MTGKDRLKIVFAILFFAACTAVFVATIGAELWEDLAIRREGAVPAADARIASVHCRQKKLIFSECDIRIEVDGQRRPLHVDFTALAGYSGSPQTTAVRSAAVPSRITSSLNIEALDSRMIAFALLCGLSLGFVIIGLAVLFRGRSAAVGQADVATQAGLPRVTSTPSSRRKGSVQRASSFWRRAP
ncbi:MAG: hypothetical protein H6876_01715 [Hyphomicrobiaceae bacterium]|nr:hypothetical protein [Hyphomicrobiaceae bacterium]